MCAFIEKYASVSCCKNNATCNATCIATICSRHNDETLSSKNIVIYNLKREGWRKCLQNLRKEAKGDRKKREKKEKKKKKRCEKNMRSAEETERKGRTSREKSAKCKNANYKFVHARKSIKQLPGSRRDNTTLRW
ncbi:hypothetical protein PUN28_018939 [Cardiocondyla obscurior]|uniref:Uncharacterized protein n=1 Tax=Cardiocondyla obscurior TaxID=286306 RepID=A0AAW2EGL9_9HYME